MNVLRRDLTGQRFGRLLVLPVTETRSGYKRFWLARCDCGVKKMISHERMVNGTTASCGCLKREMTVARNYRHGLSKTREYKIWTGMWGRCTNPKIKHFKNYGGRGIKVHESWKSFEQFLADVGHSPHPKSEIDRRDNDGDYEPSNVHWMSQLEQARNRRNSLHYTHDGRTQSLTAWAAEFGFNYHSLYYRLKERSLTFAQAVTMPWGRPTA